MTEDHLLPEQLSEYMDGHLSPPLMQAIDRHLADCAECQTHLGDLRRVRDAMKDAPLMTPPESFYEGVKARLESAPEPARRPWWNAWTKTAASACVVLIAVLVARDQTGMRMESRVTDIQTKLDSESRPQQPTAVPYALQNREQPADDKASNKMAGLKATDLAFSPRAANGAAEEKSLGERAEAIANAKMNEASPAEGRALYDQAVPASPAPAEPKRKQMAAAGKNMGSAFLAQKGGGDAALSGSAAVGAVSKKESSAGLRARRALTQNATPWKGAFSGITVPRTVVVQSEPEWLALWKEHIANQPDALPMPVVNFARYTVIGVFAGTQPKVGYSVFISRIQFGQDAVRVQYKIISPPAGAPTGESQPFELRLLPKKQLPVEFEEVP
jgi:negative regulator of sigma E activity